MPAEQKKAAKPKGKGKGGNEAKRAADERRSSALDAAATQIQCMFRCKVARILVRSMEKERSERGPTPAELQADRDLAWRHARACINQPGYPFIEVDLTTSPLWRRRSEGHPAATVGRLSKLEVIRSGDPALLDEMGWPSDKVVVGEVLCNAEAQRVRKTFRTRSKKAVPSKRGAKAALTAPSEAFRTSKTHQSCATQGRRQHIFGANAGDDCSNATSSGATSSRSSDPAPVPDAPLELKAMATEVLMRRDEVAAKPSLAVEEPELTA